MRVKGTKALNQALTKAFKPFGGYKFQLSDCFEVCWHSKIIHFTIEDRIEDEWFYEFIKKTFGFETEHGFLLSILHEIGHIKTYDFLPSEITNFDEDESERISKQMQNANAEESKALNFEYFNLINELSATKWAVRYMRNNPEEIEKLVSAVYDALYEFYRKNGVIE